MSLSKSALFDIPFWSIQLDEVMPYHSEMAIEVESAIDASYSSAHLAHQTTSDPFSLPSKGWGLLAELSNKIYQEIVSTSFQRQKSGEFHLRRWAIRYGRLSKKEEEKLEKESVHNHYPALFSSVYYLKIPSRFEGSTDGGTRFFHPWGNLVEHIGPREFVYPSAEGRLIVFPSFVDHSPTSVNWGADSEVRIVIASDIFFVSGISCSPPTEAVIQVSAES